MYLLFLLAKTAVRSANLSPCSLFSRCKQTKLFQKEKIKKILYMLKEEFVVNCRQHFSHIDRI